MKAGSYASATVATPYKYWASLHVQAAGKPVNALRFSLWVRGGLQHPLAHTGKPWFALPLPTGNSCDNCKVATLAEEVHILASYSTVSPHSAVMWLLQMTVVMMIMLLLVAMMVIKEN